MRRFAALLLALALPFAPSVAQTAHPDFSGKWTLDPVQSGAGADGVSAVVTITQGEKTLKVEQNITSPMGNQSSTLNYTLDGTPSKNTVSAQGMTVGLSSTTAWEGPVLVVTTSAEVQGNTVKTIDHWSLDATGKVLTLSSDISFGPQSMSRKQVFNKS